MLRLPVSRRLQIIPPLVNSQPPPSLPTPQSRGRTTTTTTQQTWHARSPLSPIHWPHLGSARRPSTTQARVSPLSSRLRFPAIHHTPFHPRHAQSSSAKLARIPKIAPPLPGQPPLGALDRWPEPGLRLDSGELRGRARVAIETQARYRSIS